MLLFWMVLGGVVVLLGVLEYRSERKPEKLRPGDGPSERFELPSGRRFRQEDIGDD